MVGLTSNKKQVKGYKYTKHDKGYEYFANSTGQSLIYPVKDNNSRQDLYALFNLSNK